LKLAGVMLPAMGDSGSRPAVKNPGSRPKTTIWIFLLLGLCLPTRGAGRLTHHTFEEANRRAEERSRGNSNYIATSPIAAAPVQLWQVGLPRPGTEWLPVLLVGPGPVIALGGEGETSLCDTAGDLLGVRSGRPVGLGPEGSLVTTQGDYPLAAYDSFGTVLGHADPAADFVAYLGAAEDTLIDAVGLDGTPYTSPDLDVYCPLRVGDSGYGIVVYDVGVRWGTPGLSPGLG